MNKESLSNTENNNGNDGWVESMSEVESSSEIDFEKRKQEIEALKLDIEKAKLEAEKKRAEEDAMEAASVWDPKREEKYRADRIADSRMSAEESAYRQLSYHNPEWVADSYETHASLDNLDDKMAVSKSLAGTNDGNADVRRSNATPADATGALNGLAKRQSGRYSEYQDAAAKQIDNTLGGIDRKLDILEKHNPDNSGTA